jgi:hypothetical protein
LAAIEVIYLTRQDTIDAACEMLEHSTPGSQVWMVLPWRAKLGLKLVNLKRLKRTAQNLALDLRLVTRHLYTRSLAREAGISTHMFVPDRLRSYRRARRYDTQGLAARVVPVSERLGQRWERKPRDLSVRSAFLSLTGLVGLLGILAIVVGALVPSATITIAPQAQPVSGTFHLQANTTYREADYEEGIIPARRVQVIVEGRGETPATGSISVPGEYASGEVVFTNRTDQPVTVPQGTIVRTSSGVTMRFYTVEDVQLPPALHGHARVGIVATDPGPVGNVRALTINAVDGEIARYVNVLNNVGTVGGAYTQVPVVSYQDFDKLQADLARQLQDEAYERLVSELEAGEFIPVDSLDVQIMSREFDQVVNEQSDVLSAQMKVVVGGTAVDGIALQLMAAHLLEEGAGRDMRILMDSLEIDHSDRIQADERSLLFTIQARGLVAPEIEEKQIKTAIRGREVPNASQWLAEHLDLSDQASIEITPDWWPRIPLLPARIDVIVASR